MSPSNIKKGFTLIELMVVVAIIAILTAIITANLSQSKSKARDGKRVSDVAQLQGALELFFDRCNVYPSSLSTGASCTLSDGSSLSLSVFIAQIPKDPSGGTYQYAVNTSPATDYILHATLENSSLVDRYTGSQLYGVNCSGDKDYCMLPR